MVRISARYEGDRVCPNCGSDRLRLKDKRLREPRHESWGLRGCILEVESLKFRCKDYATTFCDLRSHTICDVVLGRSEAALEDYLAKLPGKDRVRIVCMDLASVYRAIVRKHFPNAKIVADRFHVIRLINHHFLACWREIDPAGGKNRGLLC